MNFQKIKQSSILEGNVKEIYIDGILHWRKPYVYGVSWAKGTASSMTRTDNASSFSDPVIGSGTTKGSSPFDDCFPWNEIKQVTDGNNTLVYIPRFWYKWTDSTSALKLQIANMPLEGFHTSPMHADRGDGYGEREYAYIGRYKCISSTYYSKTGGNPQRSITRATARSKIAALGSGYYQMDYAAFWTLRMLYLVEFADWDAVTKISQTSTVSAIASVVTGYTDSMTYHTGVSSDGYGIQYRYVKNPWNNCLEWIDGIYFDTDNVYCIKNPSKFSDTSNGTKVATKLTSDGFIKSWDVPIVSGFEYALWPSAVNGTTNSYIKDYYYPESGTVLYTGGSPTMLTNHGPFFLYCDFTASSTSSFIGARMMKLP